MYKQSVVEKYSFFMKELSQVTVNTAMVAEKIIQILPLVMGCCTCLIYFVDENHDNLIMYMKHNNKKMFSSQSGIAGHVFRTKAMLLLKKPEQVCL